ncbi:alpha/beta fold hydrolase [Rhizobium rosettiformans]|uniref:alpha/beta fold hydrolase n=1 Tax=Rhizobium rosettiformans TaxID=1368430 RepID=UPI0028677A44|nr:alpha/beta fold hydrolase [Rhizobium rosettiformans]MDR7029671.1 pyruvate dehydrogenase E2 component (dihydrolipoamide acetyltransferase) [Rhizobium rosettiformans]MDR7063385.1 pyruvate dehydrogenase E2 component (dihydrolipoamide acetyltransferase) [Rhizobium rosettiformans]
MTLFAEVRHASSAKTPLVLLHGFGAIGSGWAPVTGRLDDDQPLIVYDLPGHGSSLDAEGVGHAGVMAKAILEDLGRRGLSSLHLCGHSMGGAVASLVALKAADRVRSLTLLAPGGFGFEINHEALRRYAVAAEQGELATALAGMRAPGPVADRSGLERLAAARQAPGAVDRLLAILASFLIVRDGRTGQGTLPLRSFDGLGIPTRLLWGTADPILPDKQATTIWPNAVVTLVEGAGHMLIEEATEAVVTAIQSQL